MEKVDPARPLSPSQQALLAELEGWHDRFCADHLVDREASGILGGVLDGVLRGLFDSGFEPGEGQHLESDEGLLLAQQRRCEIATEAVLETELGLQYARELFAEIQALDRPLRSQ